MSFLLAVAVYTLFYSEAKAHFDCSKFLATPLFPATFSQTPTADFKLRDRLPQTSIPREKWDDCCGRFGPFALRYPQVIYPPGVPNLVWDRQRVIAAAKKWLGLPYAHYHFPNMGGLDCSNFTAFVYNYALGVGFTSNILAQSEEVGRRLHPSEPLAPGDLLFLYSVKKARIYHVVIYLRKGLVIDASRSGVKIREFKGKYAQRFAWARRIIE
jgi:hypothetical protein